MENKREKCVGIQTQLSTSNAAVSSCEVRTGGSLPPALWGSPRSLRPAADSGANAVLRTNGREQMLAPHSSREGNEWRVGKEGVKGLWVGGLWFASQWKCRIWVGNARGGLEHTPGGEIQDLRREARASQRSGNAPTLGLERGGADASRVVGVGGLHSCISGVAPACVWLCTVPHTGGLGHRCFMLLCSLCPVAVAALREVIS